MPESPMTQEMVVTNYVNNRFGDESYDSYIGIDGREYREYASAPYERWVDSDRDGWVDYGRRDAGYGHWHTFDGFQWKDANGTVVMDWEPPIGGGENLTTPVNPGVEDGWLF